MHLKNIIFIIVLIGFFSFFAWSISRIVRYLKLAKPENRFDRIDKRVGNVLAIAFGQTKIFRDPIAGPIHAGIFWGFLVLLTAIVESIGEGLVHGFSLSFLGPINSLIMLGGDVMGVIVIVAVLLALFRRHIYGPARVRDIEPAAKVDAAIILCTIGSIMITMFLQNAAHMALGEAGADAHRWRPVSSAIASMLSASQGTAVLYEIAWWAHIVLVLSLLNFLPYSKHFHVLTSIPNVFFSNKGIRPEGDGALKPVDLEDESLETFGVTDVDDLSWKQVLDGYTCTECGRCTSVCPANQTGKLLSPRKIIVDTRHRFQEKAPLLAAGRIDDPAMEKTLLNSYITPQELWACTTCRACVQECPVMNEHVDEIVDLRRALVLTQGEFPELLQGMYRNMENNFAAWQFSPEERADWAKGLDIPQLSEIGSAADIDVLFWVGCAGAFDARYRKVSVAFAQIMKKAGIRFAILGTEEKCTGDSARRTGNEYLAQTLIRENIETLNKYGVKEIVTACPHCFHALRNEFPQFGGNYRVHHHSRLINDLLETGRILPLRKLESAMTYHDSCYLGRYNDIYEQPRAVLTSIPGAQLVEMPRNHDRAFCCGAGGGQMFMEETEGTRVNLARTDEALATGASTICTACPFCLTMMADGVKARDKVDDVAVKDIAEVVWEAIG
jgi:Fe-S oxidoreductase